MPDENINDFDLKNVFHGCQSFDGVYQKLKLDTYIFCSFFAA